MSRKRKRLFSTDHVDDAMFMCSELHVNKTFKKAALEFHHDKQGSDDFFTLYYDGIVELNEFLNKWLTDNN